MNSRTRFPRSFPRFAPHLALAGLALALTTLAGCGMRSGNDNAATQVAAKVNGEEISVHQINFVLQRQPGLKQEQLESAGRQVLDRLIDQEIAVQKAQADKLDRDPRVVQELEAARREIMARAYLAKVGEAAARPNAQEIKAYFDAKPGLFGARRIYTLQEVQVQGDKARIEDLQKMLASARTMQQISDYLKEKNFPVRVSQNTAAAENLPMALVDRLATMQEGQTAFSAVQGGARLVTVLKAQPAPITEEKAQPVIERFLLNERKRVLVEQEVKAMRSAAKIEFVGSFASAASAPAPAEAGASEALAPAASSALDASALEKGLSGLK